MMTSFKYTGTALPDVSETVVLFDSTVAFPGAFYFQMNCIHRLVVTLNNDQAGTLKAYYSNDRGATWTQAFGDISVAIPSTGDVNIEDFLVEPFADFKVEFENSTDAQTLFDVSVVGTDERTVAN